MFRSSRPSAVRVIPAAERTKIVIPSSSSNAQTILLMPGWETYRA